MSIAVPLEGNTAPSFKRPPGQATGAQWRGSSMFINLPGYRLPAAPGKYSTYRRMAANPTVAFVYAATRAVMKAPKWSVEADEGVPDEVVEFLEDAFIRHKAAIINHGTTARLYGHASFEKVWERDEDGRLYPCIKPLIADITTPMVERESGRFVGIKQTEKDVFLGLTKCWHFAYDGEANDPWGRSILENIRCTAWRAWEDTAHKMAQYTTKAAGVIPVANMPLGTGEGPDGSRDENQKYAEKLLRDLGAGAGIVMPNQLSHEVMRILEAYPKLAELFMWRVSFLDVPSGHGTEFLDMLKQEETRMVRGMLWPERALTEGQFGTKAESGVQMDIGLMICEQDLAEFVEDFNHDVVDDALEANWGATYRGKARIKVGPLRDTEREFFRDLLKQLILNPVALDTASQIIDIDGLLDENGFPKAMNVVDVNQALQTPQPGQTPPGAPPVPPTPPGPPEPPQPEDRPTPVKLSRDITIPPGAVPSVEPTPAQAATARKTLTGAVRRWLGR